MIQFQGDVTTGVLHLADHGWALDTSSDGHYQHVRAFKTHTASIEGVPTEMPTPINMREAAEAMQDAAQRLFAIVRWQESCINRPILVLDVDGVLNTVPGSIDADKVQRLAAIQERTGCVTVLSSSWRHSPAKLDQLSKVIQWSHVTPKMHQLPEELSLDHRRREIEAWIQWFEPTKPVVVLDDMPLAMSQQVLVDPRAGLQDIHVDMIVKRMI